MPGYFLGCRMGAGIGNWVLLPHSPPSAAQYSLGTTSFQPWQHVLPVTFAAFHCGNFKAHSVVFPWHQLNPSVHSSKDITLKEGIKHFITEYQNKLHWLFNFSYLCLFFFFLRDKETATFPASVVLHFFPKRSFSQNIAVNSTVNMTNNHLKSGLLFYKRHTY